MADLIEREKHYQVFLRYGRREFKVPAFLLTPEGKRRSEKLGRNLHELLEAKDAGNVPPELRRYVEQLPERIRRSLAKQGVIDAGAEGRTLAQHAEDYRQALEQQGNTPRHAKETHATIAAAAACGCKMTGAVTPAKLRAYLADRHAAKPVIDKATNKPMVDAAGKPVMRPGISAQRVNHIIAGLHAFYHWAMKERRFFENPWANVRKLNAKTDVRHARRAITADEARALLDAAANSIELAGMPGAERTLIYRTALETGLRLNELATLTRDCLDLDAGTLVVRAGYSKRRREDVLPMRPALVEALRGHGVDTWSTKPQGARFSIRRIVTRRSARSMRT